ncbi:MAG: amidase, partial [Fimbriimonadaceae bacterium]|nr:amidase [Fimbriimonadaceae bacterium]
TRQGSSGSSAGSASAVAAGLVPFAIGTETLGSIISPSHRCRVTGLRPTFGRVSRHGAMPLSWTMDKVGPIGRTAMDCLAVLLAISGQADADSGTVAMPWQDPARVRLNRLKVGLLKGAFPLDEEDGEADLPGLIKRLGLEPVEAEFTPPEDSATLGLSVEAAASFDALTRSGEVDRVERSAWPGIFRAHRYVPAVEYIQSLRHRTRIMERFEREFGDLDVVVAPDRGSHLLITTNLTGHPQIYIPLDDKGRGVSLIGRVGGEAILARFGQAVQEGVGFHRLRPAGF